MPDYKAMYFELFRASVQAVQLLQDAQAHAEQQLLAEDPVSYTHLDVYKRQRSRCI